MRRSLRRVLASGLGTGFAPLAPGTAGTLAAVPLAWALNSLPWAPHLLILAATVPVAAHLCDRAAQDDGRADPRWIVLDEWVGFCISVFRAPATVDAYLAGFFLFRLFDILKPPPAGWVDRNVPGGWGILLDDVLAGLFGRLTLLALAWIGVPGLAS